MKRIVLAAALALGMVAFAGEAKAAGFSFGNGSQGSISFGIGANLSWNFGPAAGGCPSGTCYGPGYAPQMYDSYGYGGYSGYGYGGYPAYGYGGYNGYGYGAGNGYPASNAAPANTQTNTTKNNK